MIQNEAQGLGGALEHLLFLKISGDLVLATGRSLGTELVDLNTKRVTRVIGQGKPADALCALPSDGVSDTLLVGGPDGIIRQYEPQTGALRRQQQVGDGAIRDLAVAEKSGCMLAAVASEGGVRLLLVGSVASAAWLKASCTAASRYSSLFATGISPSQRLLFPSAVPRRYAPSAGLNWEGLRLSCAFDPGPRFVCSGLLYSGA